MSTDSHPDIGDPNTNAFYESLGLHEKMVAQDQEDGRRSHNRVANILRAYDLGGSTRSHDDHRRELRTLVGDHHRKSCPLYHDTVLPARLTAPPHVRCNGCPALLDDREFEAKPTVPPADPKPAGRWRTVSAMGSPATYELGTPYGIFRASVVVTSRGPGAGDYHWAYRVETSNSAFTSSTEFETDVAAKIAAEQKVRAILAEVGAAIARPATASANLDADTLADRLIWNVLRTLDCSDAWTCARREPDVLRDVVKAVLGAAIEHPSHMRAWAELVADTACRCTLRDADRTTRRWMESKVPGPQHDTGCPKWQGVMGVGDKAVLDTVYAEASRDNAARDRPPAASGSAKDFAAALGIDERVDQLDRRITLAERAAVEDAGDLLLARRYVDDHVGALIEQIAELTREVARVKLHVEASARELSDLKLNIEVTARAAASKYIDAFVDDCAREIKQRIFGAAT